MSITAVPSPAPVRLAGQQDCSRMTAKPKGTHPLLARARVVWPLFWYPPVLAYHRVHPTPSSETPTMSPEAFDRQMEILAQRWNPVPLSAVMESLETGKPLPHRAVAVTFDDGTNDNFTYAFPVLTRHRIPATIFQIAGQVGRPGFLSADQIQQMAQGGVSFGSHGLNHEYLPSLSGPELKRTLSESKQLIENLGIPAEIISYPGGGFTAEVIEAAKAAGYRAGCTTNRGFRRFPPDRWALRRITMHEQIGTPAGIWLNCCGYSGINRKLRAPS